MTRATLNTLLDAAAGLGPEYGDGLSSHLPMALVALAAMGADNDRLQRFFRRYASRWPTATPGVVEVEVRDPWGHPEAFASQRRQWQRALVADGRDRVLRRALPRLMAGVAGAAFHGLIRTAYAVQADHDEELAAALSYWVCRWQPLPAPGVGPPPMTATDWVDALRQAPPGPAIAGRLIVDRVAQVVAEPGFSRWAVPVDWSPDQTAQLAVLAAQRYASSGNFTVLHLVTAGHALRLLRPWLDEAADEPFVRAFAAAWLSAGTDPGKSSRPDPGWDWAQIVRRAVAQEDDHVIKLVHSCREEAAAYGDAGIWRHAAALAVDRAG